MHVTSTHSGLKTHADFKMNLPKKNDKILQNRNRTLINK